MISVQLGQRLGGDNSCPVLLLAVSVGHCLTRGEMRRHQATEEKRYCDPAASSRKPHPSPPLIHTKTILATCCMYGASWRNRRRHSNGLFFPAFSYVGASGTAHDPGSADAHNTSEHRKQRHFFPAHDYTEDECHCGNQESCSGGTG